MEDQDFIEHNSGHIHSSKYDSFARTMTLRFQNGYEYEVSGMHPKDYERFLNAPSQGNHFHSEIKNTFAVERVK